MRKGSITNLLSPTRSQRIPLKSQRIPLKIHQTDQDATPSTHLSLQALVRVLSPSIVDDVLRECSAHEQHTRKSPASAVMLLYVSMNLYATDCLTHVFFRLLSGVPWLLTNPTHCQVVSKGASSQARYRLGARPLVAFSKESVANRWPRRAPLKPSCLAYAL